MRQRAQALPPEKRKGSVQAWQVRHQKAEVVLQCLLTSCYYYTE